MAAHPDLPPTELAVVTFNHVPEHNPTFKYDRLGPLAVRNRRAYCARHGYRFVGDVDVDPDRPACWAKIPALLEALEHHPWVLWADSDTLVTNPERRLEEFLDPRFDMVVQSHDEFFRLIGVDPARGLERMPINTGVFLMRSRVLRLIPGAVRRPQVRAEQALTPSRLSRTHTTFGPSA